MGNFLFFVYSDSRSTSKRMPNSKDFYNGIFLHVIPVRIIVPWIDGKNYMVNQEEII